MQEFIQHLNQVAEAHYHNDLLKASNLHKYLQMSRSALHYKLKKNMDQSTAEYLRRFRINKAKTLLLTSDDPVKIIAFQVGFKDPNYFSRVFKNLEGKSPSQFRINANLNNSP